MNALSIPLPGLELLDPARFDTAPVLKQLAASSRQLAELKGLAASIPSQGILINTLGLQEAQDSSEIEYIVTTHGELFKDDVNPEGFGNAAANCRRAAKSAIVEWPTDARPRFPVTASLKLEADRSVPAHILRS